MHRIIYIFQEKKYAYLPYLKFSDPLSETHLLFYFALELFKIIFLVYIFVSLRLFL